MKIIAVGMNYADHNKGLHHSLLLSEPVIFMKPDSALLKNGKPFFRVRFHFHFIPIKPNSKRKVRRWYVKSLNEIYFCDKRGKSPQKLEKRVKQTKPCRYW
jgi:hypothetical protein